MSNPFIRFDHLPPAIRGLAEAGWYERESVSPPGGMVKDHSPGLEDPVTGAQFRFDTGEQVREGKFELTEEFRG